MPDYWGLDAIAKRMNVHFTTLLRWHRTQHFFMYERRRVLTRGRKPRRIWYTNDELITRWEVAQCALHWRARHAKPPTDNP